MIGTTGGAALLLINLLCASALGVGAGRLTCFALRQPWSVSAALKDAVLATSVAVFTAYIMSLRDIASHAWASRVMLVLAIATASVVVEHLLRLMFRSRG